MSFLVRLPTHLYEGDAFADFAPGGFSLGTARAMAWLAQLAYEDEDDKIDSILAAWQLRRRLSFARPLISPLQVVSTGGFVAEGPGATFVVFQGTDPLLLANWVTNFNFRPDGEGIHQGFAAALDAAWPDVKDALTRAPAAPLIIVGHSLGGALAVLCARRIRTELGVTAESVHSFGMPRVGNAAFASAFNEVFGGTTYRLVHGEDIAATVPPSELKFAHVGRILLCPRHAKFDAALLSPQPSDAPPFAAGLLSGVKVGLLQLLSGSLPPETRTDPLGRTFRLLPPGIADHLPDRYCRALSP
jgi:triacylglycerol lipase